MTAIRSRDNPRARRWHALARDSRERAREGSALLEGAHLLAAYLAAGGRPRSVVVSESDGAREEIAGLVDRAGLAPVRVSDALMRWIADVQSPSGLIAEVAIPEPAGDASGVGHAVFLDGVQDTGNVGTILRTSAAFGADAVILGPGCADPWSPKVLRAGMGGHFALRIGEVPDLVAALRGFRGRLVCAEAGRGEPPASIDLSGPLGWIFGAEGRGVSPAAAACASLRVRVPLAKGAESLNVGAAAAVLLYERWRQLSTRGARS